MDFHKSFNRVKQLSTGTSGPHKNRGPTKNKFWKFQVATERMAPELFTHWFMDAEKSLASCGTEVGWNKFKINLCWKYLLTDVQSLS